MKTPLHTVDKLLLTFLSGLIFWSSSVGLGLAAEPTGEGGLKPLVWQTDLAIWTAVVFAILLFVLWYFAFGPIVKALDQREQFALDREAAVEKSKADAKELLEQYSQRLSDSETEVRRIISDAKQGAQKQAEAIIAEAKQFASEERSRALKDIQVASDVALQEIAERSATLATALAGKIIREEVDPAKHASLIDGAIGDISK